MYKNRDYNLVEGSIVDKLFLVALPLIAMQVFQMAYNLTDMFWLGKLSSDAVAASGTVGLFSWLAMAFLIFGRMGAEIGVSQSLGRREPEEAQKYAYTSLQIGVAAGVVLAIIFIYGRVAFIGLFGIKEAHVAQDACDYLMLVSCALPFSFIIGAVSGIFNGSGNTRVSLLINAFGALMNMALDPLLIFTAGLGIRGAGIATIIAQASAASLALVMLKKHKNRPFTTIKLLKRPDIYIVKRIFKWVAPISVESFLFTFLSMMAAALIAAYGANAMAASRVGTQIESMTWLIAGGYASALTAYIGQNFGAGKLDRIHKGFRISTALMSGWGVIAGLTLFFLGGPLFKVFLPNDPAVVEIGAEYMRILALVQVPACLEGVAAGVFRGQGRTMYPSVSSVTTNALRVVLAFILTRYTPLGLTGIWIALAAGAGARGMWMFIWYLFYARKMSYKRT